MFPHISPSRYPALEYPVCRVTVQSNTGPLCEEDGWLLWRECDGRLTADQHNEHPLHRHRRGMDVNKEELTMYSDNASYFGGMLCTFWSSTWKHRIPGKCPGMWLDFTLCRSRKVFIMEMWLWNEFKTLVCRSSEYRWYHQSPYYGFLCWAEDGRKISELLIFWSLGLAPGWSGQWPVEWRQQ